MIEESLTIVLLICRNQHVISVVSVLHGIMCRLYTEQ